MPQPRVYKHNHHHAYRHQAPIVRADQSRFREINLVPLDLAPLIKDYRNALDRILKRAMLGTRHMRRIMRAYRTDMESRPTESFMRDDGAEHRLDNVPTTTMREIDGLEIDAWNILDGKPTAKVIEGKLEALSNANAVDLTKQYSTILGLSPKNFDDQTKAILAKALDINISKVKSIGTLHHGDLRKVIAIGYAKGTSYDEMAKEISQRFGVTERRGHFIAWNEIGNLNGELTKHRQTKNGITHYRWSTSLDERVRPTHVEKEGKIFAWAEPPPDTGHPGYDYRCRCVAQPLFDESLFDVPEPEVLPADPIEELKALRNEIGMSQRAFAPEIGRSQAWLSGIEQGKAALPDDAKRNLAAYFHSKGIDPERLRAAFGEYDPIADMPTPRKPKPKAVAKPEAPKPVESVVADRFPEALDDLETVKTLGGSTGAKLVRDPNTGDLFVMKSGANPAHIQEEFLTNQIYRALGANIPESRIYNGNTTLNVFIEGKSIGSLKGQAFEAAAAEARKDFAADALLANWDVAGLDLDNLLVDNTGKVWRIDNGSGLRFRAQGGAKGAAFDDWITELWTLRDPKKNASAARVFGATRIDEIAEQAKSIIEKRDDVLRLVDDQSLRDQLSRRFDQLDEIQDLVVDMDGDGWELPYIDRFNKHRQGLGQSGAREALPTELNPVNESLEAATSAWKPQFLNATSSEASKLKIVARDSNNKNWDHLRGEDSLMSKYYDYLGTLTNGNIGIEQQLAQLHMIWASDQARDSWSPAAHAVKYWIAKNRAKAKANYYWRSGIDGAEAEYKKFLRKMPDTKSIGLTKDEAFDEVFTIFHAFNYEVIRKAKMPTKSLDNKNIVVVRTENESSVLARQNMRSKGAEGNITRGPAESTSLFHTFYYQGDATVLTNVPLHRVFASYLPDKGLAAYDRKYGARSRNYQSPQMFAGDRENEAVVIMENSENKVFGLGMNRSGDRLPISEVEEFIESKKGKVQSATSGTPDKIKVPPKPPEPPPPPPPPSIPDVAPGNVSVVPFSANTGEFQKLIPSEVNEAVNGLGEKFDNVFVFVDGVETNVYLGPWASMYVKNQWMNPGFNKTDLKNVIFENFDFWVSGPGSDALKNLDAGKKMALMLMAPYNQSGSPSTMKMISMAKSLGWI